MQNPLPQPRIGTVSRRLATMLLGFIIATMLFFLLFGANRSFLVTAQENKQADVIVQFDDQAHLLRTIAFTQPISGLVALQWSGLAVITTATSFGPAVCSIEGVGCPVENCFCDANRFWAYTYWDGSAWQSYAVGANSSVISQTGAIEGWRWGEFGATQLPVTQTLAAGRALTQLQSSQSITNGGYVGVGAAVETLLAIGSNHWAADDWRRGSSSPSLADYLAVNGAAFARSNAAGAGKLALAVATAATCLPAGALTPQGHYSPTLGAYSRVDLTAWRSSVPWRSVKVSRRRHKALLNRPSRQAAAGSGRRGGARIRTQRGWPCRR